MGQAEINVVIEYVLGQQLTREDLDEILETEDWFDEVCQAIPTSRPADHSEDRGDTDFAINEIRTRIDSILTISGLLNWYREENETYGNPEDKEAIRDIIGLIVAKRVQAVLMRYSSDKLGRIVDGADNVGRAEDVITPVILNRFGIEW